MRLSLSLFQIGAAFTGAGPSSGFAVGNGTAGGATHEPQLSGSEAFERLRPGDPGDGDAFGRQTHHSSSSDRIGLAGLSRGVRERRRRSGGGPRFALSLQVGVGDRDDFRHGAFTNARPRGGVSGGFGSRRTRAPLLPVVLRWSPPAQWTNSRKP